MTNVQLGLVSKVSAQCGQIPMYKPHSQAKMSLDFHLLGVQTKPWWFLSDSTKYEEQHSKNVLGGRTYKGLVPTTHLCLQIKKIKGYVNTKLQTFHGWLQNDK